MSRDTGWIRSSYSAAASNSCVEVRRTDAHTAVRDSKSTGPTLSGPTLSIPTTAWTAFLTSLRP